MTELQARALFVNTAIAWLGVTQGSAKHAEILGIYNSFRPLPRGYAVKPSDAWCAAFASVPGISLGWADILPVECSCNNMISLYQRHALSRWEERDDYMPQPGDLIMYGWDDPADGYAAMDFTGPAKHVGIVCSVDGERFDVVEGNYSRSVKIRGMRRNGRYIRGFCLPAFHLKVEGGISVDQYKEISARLDALERRSAPVYKTIEDVKGKWGEEGAAVVSVAVARGVIKGTSGDDLGLSWQDVRWLVIAYRREHAQARMSAK